MEKTIKEFIEGTPVWHKEFTNTDKPCAYCGIIPDNMLKLSKTLKEVDKKAREEERERIVKLMEINDRGDFCLGEQCFTKEYFNDVDRDLVEVTLNHSLKEDKEV